MGDGYHRPALEALCRELGIEDRVTFLGYCADIWPVIQALDVQVFPSYREGTPNTLYEALAVGNVIVASTADGQGEILTDEREALLYAPGDGEAMERHVERLHDDASLRERLAKAAAHRARDFDMRQTIDTLRRTYLNIMGEQ